MVNKFVYHLPLFRQAIQFLCLGMAIPRSTLSGWVGQTADLLKVLYDKLAELVKQAHYLQGDETTIKVLQDKVPKNKGSTGPAARKQPRKTHTGYYWKLWDPINKIGFFSYDKSRSKTVPFGLLKGFTGRLQVDGYAGYVGLDKFYDIILFNCWAHARRKFIEALGNAPEQAEYALSEIGKLYAIEDWARENEFSFDQRLKLRQEKALPIITKLFDWMATQSESALPKSSLAKALGYCLNRKKGLLYYTTDGEVEIDNNLIENQMRPVALGRKNYLFAGSHKAAQWGAIFYSFFACCKAHEVDPYTWLLDVLNRIPTHPVNRIEELLPHLWKTLNKDNPTTNHKSGQPHAIH